jgi:hypothetical protein
MRKPDRNTIQVFTYGPLEFNVSRGLLLASNRRKYQAQLCQPRPGWIGPFITIDEDHVERCAPTEPVLFATLALPGHPRQLLIDGNHRVAHALRYNKPVSAIVLDLEDTLKIVTGPVGLLQQMRHGGQSLGVLRW